MKKLSNISKIVILGIVAVIIIVSVIIYGPNHGSQSIVATNPSNATVTAEGSTVTPGQSPTPPVIPQPPANRVPSNIPPQSPASPTINVLSPVANDIWKIGAENLILWNKPPGISGSISLIDAKTKQFIGIILNQIGPNQTSYTWKTTNVSLSRTNPAGKNVVPGTYQIELSFDGNHLAPATSPAFTITN